METQDFTTKKSTIGRIIRYVLCGLTLVLATILTYFTVINGIDKSYVGTFAVDISGLSVTSVKELDGDYYIGTAKGEVLCFDSDDYSNAKWRYSYSDAFGTDTVSAVTTMGVSNGKVYVAFEDRCVRVFDVNGDGAPINVVKAATVTRQMAFNENVPEFYCLYGEIEGNTSSRAINAVLTADVGTETDPVTLSSAKYRAMRIRADDGFGSITALHISSDGEILYATDMSEICAARIVDEKIIVSDITIHNIFDSPIKAIVEYNNGLACIDTNGVVRILDENFNLTNSYPVKKSVSSALSFENTFVCKVVGGGIAVVNFEERTDFQLSTGKDAYIIYAANNEFAFYQSYGGSFNFYTIEEAAKTAKANILFTIFIITSIIAILLFSYQAFCLFEKTRKVVNGIFVKIGKSFWKHKICYLSLVPTFVLLAIFYYYPILRGFGISFFNYTPGEPATFVGFENFASVFRNATFWGSFLNMFKLLFSDLLKALIPPFLFAEAIFAVKSKRFSFWVRVLLFIPGILPGIAGTLVWAEGIFGRGSVGLLNSILPSFMQHAWLYEDGTALASLICFGFPWVGSYLIFYGAIMGVPPSMFEAAKLDGCGPIKKIFYFDIPMILPQFKYIFITSFIASVQDYGRILVTTGGQYSTNVPALMMYEAITDEKNYGKASVMGIILFAFLSIATFLNFKMQSKKDDD